MAKTYLGIDVGHDMLKLALVKGNQVKKTAIVPMPANLLREGRITSTDTLGELIERTMKENRIRAGRAAAIVSGENCYLRTTSMPRMNVEQLAYNIPYEFSDYITGELKDYLFDYAVIPELPGENAGPTPGVIGDEEEGGEAADRLRLLVSAVSRESMEDLRRTLRKAGMKMAVAAPVESAYLSLIRDHEARTGEKDREYCILDLGYRAIRMYMFHGPRHIATRTLEIGLSSLNDIIAENKNVDSHLAHTYLLTNFEDCQTADYCMSAYDNIAVELMRALNFYRFSNPDSQISTCWLCGGGAELRPLHDSISATLDIEVRTADELVENGTALADGFDYVQAIGIALN